MASSRMVVTIENGRGMDALRKAIAIAKELEESQPWNDDAKEIRSHLTVVVEEMTCIPLPLRTK